MADEDLARRALAGWFRSGETATVTPEVVEAAGRRYVVMRDGQGAAVATYRVRYDGRLRRMRQAPPEVTGEVTR